MPQDPRASETIEPGEVSESDVAAFLARDPEFFARHHDLLDRMVLPAERATPSVVDLRAYLVDRQRGEIDRLRRQQRAIVSASRANMNTQQRVHAAILFLLDAESFEQLIQAITTDLAVLLDLDVAQLLIEADGEGPIQQLRTGVRVLPAGDIDARLGGRDAMLAGAITGDAAIFGEGAGLVCSQALIRLSVSSVTPPALLALGSRDPEMFESGMRTELMGFLARVLERCIRDWLDLPA